jgi:TolA-binding protein
MSVRAFSEMTYYSALSLERLGKKAAAKKLLRELLNYAEQLRKSPAKVDYFATSLPMMLLFDEDINARQQTNALFLEGQALLGLGRNAEARKRLLAVLDRDPSHPIARDLMDQMPS